MMSWNSTRTAAFVTGISLLIMAILGGFAYGVVLKGLITPNDATTTFNNIKSSMTLFRYGIFSFLIILICDVVAAWGLHVFFKKANENLSLLTAWFRLVYSAILGCAMINFIFVILLLDDANYLSTLQLNQIHALVLYFLNAFFSSWSIGLIVFGCHLSLLGYLVYQSDYAPKTFGILLIIAGLCYFCHHSANLLLSNYEKYKDTVDLITSLPMIIGELGFGLWLLFKGGATYARDSNKRSD